MAVLPPKRRKRNSRIETPEWLVTYGDMITLLLAFFIALFTVATVDGYEIRLILSAFPGIGNLGGGNTLQEGRLPELGNSILALPATIRERQFNQRDSKRLNDLEVAIIEQQAVIREEERGLVVSLGADLFFGPGSGTVDIDNARGVLQNVALLLQHENYQGRRFRIEGHTDSLPPDPEGPWPTNWDLSVARSLNILQYLVDLGVNEQQFEVMGLADTSPLAGNDTPQGRSINRRVDVVILHDGQL